VKCLGNFPIKPVCRFCSFQSQSPASLLNNQMLSSEFQYKLLLWTPLGLTPISFCSLSSMLALILEVYASKIMTELMPLNFFSWPDVRSSTDHGYVRLKHIIRYKRGLSVGKFAVRFYNRWRIRSHKRSCTRSSAGIRGLYKVRPQAPLSYNPTSASSTFTNLDYISQPHLTASLYNHTPSSLYKTVSS